MIFDPEYAVNGHFYVSYTTDSGGVFGRGVSHIARFTVSTDPDIADRERGVPDPRGLYVFGDCFGPDDGDFTGRIFTLNYSHGVASDFQDITSQLFPTRIGGYTLTGVTSLGQDAVGEI
jgi:hypothetical protein